MQIATYKTNIRNEKALNELTPVLNNIVGAANWQFDSNSIEKKLTVFAHGVLDERRLAKAFQRAGYRLENLDDYYAIY